MVLLIGCVTVLVALLITHDHSSTGTPPPPKAHIPASEVYINRPDTIPPGTYYNALYEIIDSAKSARFRGDIKRADDLMEAVGIIHKYLFDEL